MSAKASSDLVQIFVPKAPAREQPTMFISVNGKNYFLPRGKYVMVKREVAYEFNRAMEAQNRLDEVSAELQRAAE